MNLKYTMTTKQYGRWLIFCVSIMPVFSWLFYLHLGEYHPLIVMFGVKCGICLMLFGRVFWNKDSTSK